MAKRKNMSITETIAQHLETTTEEESTVVIEEPEEKISEEPATVVEEPEEKKEEEKPSQEKINQPLSPHHLDTLTSEINTNLNFIS